MAFKITARTLFHLGSDLISSDAIALYELVKNAFDAGSREVEIRCAVRISWEQYRSLHPELRRDAEAMTRRSEMQRALAQWKPRIDAVVDATAPAVAEWRSRIASAESLVELLRAVEEANTLEVEDKGSGMSEKDLEDVYLTIGTTHRLLQKRAQLAEDANPSDRPILGDKGVGRLATMRLGTRLEVETTKEDETHWNVLDIDWAQFRANLEARLEDVDVAPVLGDEKKDRKIHGTTIRIAGLVAEWSYERLEAIAKDEIAKLTDPFSKRRFPVVLSFNDRAVKVPRFNELLTQHAHATCTAQFIVDGEDTRIEGTVDYRTANKKSHFVAKGAHLASTGKAPSLEALEQLGPFSVEVYWFNRQALKASMKKFENANEIRQVLKLEEWWAGGLMVYRDGFRVNPYGSGDDDWLKLDPKALASGGYKMNRRQIVGRVSVSARSNPSLVDQTNREGLQDSPELRSLIALLRYIVITEFKGFMDRTDRQAKQQPSLSVSEVKQQVSKQRKRLGTLVKDLRRAFPSIERETGLLSTLEDSIAKLEVLADEARRQIESYEEAQEKVIHLAATGLLVEILAHELNRATRHALKSLEDGRDTAMPPKTSAMFRTLETQLKTLQKRISVLDPLSTSGRQVKQTFDLVQWIGDICASHSDQFKRHGIAFDVAVYPKKPGLLNVTMVKGMLVQILENLFDNSVYWLTQQSKVKHRFRPTLKVEIDTEEVTVSVTDNGPGIDPTRRDDVFQPFYTTKPAEGGKGLGLFIAREVARYHKGELELSEVESDSGALNTFILHLGKVVAE